MAAFLDIDNFAPRRAPESRCPRLAARWQVTPDGKLTCIWHTDPLLPDRPPL